MHKLWYEKPARRWREALPLGNGFAGLMLYGGKRKEKICFNDGTLWSGHPKDYNAAQSQAVLEEVRTLIFNGEQAAADALCEKSMIGNYGEAFMPLGYVTLALHGCGTRNYRRMLELDKGLYTVQCGSAQREAFSSNPDRVSVYHITAEKPFSLTVRTGSKLHCAVVCDTALNLVGNAPDYAAPNYLRTKRRPIRYDEGKGMAFCLRTELDTDGAVLYKRNKVLVQHATTVTLYFVTATGFLGFANAPDTSRENVLAQCKKALAGVSKDYALLKKRHIRDFSDLYTRQSIDFGTHSALPTDKLLQQLKTNETGFVPLCELFYNYGKYMLISGSRKGGQPLNLQGIWNDSIRPPWSSNYTVNINTEMNYWGASRAGLSDCIEPLVQMVYETMQNGQKTAAVNYGCQGFACNHNVDIWRKTAPVRGNANYMFAPLCGVWLANELYTHYQNGYLQAYQDKIAEIVTEAARFADAFLVLHDGQYVICPSPSPENTFTHKGKACKLDYASAFDMGLVRQVFQNALEISDDDQFKTRIREKLALLYPFQSGSNGICEWHCDYTTPEPGHRHFSPLYAFYPGNVIGYTAHPEQRAWVEKLFRYRLANSGQHIGWSAAWAICLAGRLRVPEIANKVLHDLLRHAVFQNLFCVHPPFYFQIDGNLGFVAGLNELLLTEENDVLTLLPALLDCFSAQGRVQNMVVRGAKISFCWKDGVVTSLHSDHPVTVSRLHLAEDVKVDETIQLQGDEIK